MYRRWAWTPAPRTRSEAGVIPGGVGGGPVLPGDPVPLAGVLGAEERPALETPVAGGAAVHPLPDVSGHVRKPVGVRREQSDGGESGEAVPGTRMGGKETVEQIRDRLAGERRAAAPGEGTVVAAAPRRVRPFGAGGQAAARGGAEGRRVVPAHLGDGVILRGGRGFRTPRPAPVRAVHPDPPGRGGHHLRVGGLGPGLVEHQRPAIALGVGFVAGLRDEGGEPGRGDLLAIEPEAAELLSGWNPDRPGRPGGVAARPQRCQQQRDGGQPHPSGPQKPKTNRNWGRNSCAPSTPNLLRHTWSSVPISTRFSAPDIALPRS